MARAAREARRKGGAQLAAFIHLGGPSCLTVTSHRVEWGRQRARAVPWQKSRELAKLVLRPAHIHEVCTYEPYETVVRVDSTPLTMVPSP